MTRIVEVAREDVRVPVGVARVQRVAAHVLRAEQVRDATVSITFVSDRRIAMLNWRYLRHRGATDVISFQLASGAVRGQVVGDVYISPQVARRNAIAGGHGVREEILRLVVHGILHVVGHEHPENEARYRSPMWRRQERLLRAAMAAA